MDESVSYYELGRVDIAPPKPGEFVIASAAVMSCGLCGAIVWQEAPPHA